MIVKKHILMSLIAALALCSPQLSAFASQAEADCVAAVVKAELAPPPAYPESIPIPHDPAKYGTLFNEARRLSLEGTSAAAGVDLARLERDIDRLAAGDPTVVAKEGTYLKEARKLASGLRSAYKLFSSTHEFPPEYQQFVRLFGKINDKLPKARVSGKVNHDLRERAQALKDFISENGSDVFNYGFVPSTFDQFRNFNTSEIHELRELLNKPMLSKTQYHEVRKAMRDYKVFFDLMANTGSADAKAAPAIDSLRKNLEWLSKSMGDEKDGLKRPDDDPEAPIASIEDHLKASINQFLNLLEKNLH